MISPAMLWIAEHGHAEDCNLHMGVMQCALALFNGCKRFSEERVLTSHYV